MSFVLWVFLLSSFSVAAKCGLQYKDLEVCCVLHETLLTLVFSALYLMIGKVGFGTFCAQLHVLIQVSRVSKWMWVLWAVICVLFTVLPHNEISSWFLNFWPFSRNFFLFCFWKCFISTSVVLSSVCLHICCVKIKITTLSKETYKK